MSVKDHLKFSALICSFRGVRRPYFPSDLKIPAEYRGAIASALNGFLESRSNEAFEVKSFDLSLSFVDKRCWVWVSGVNLQNGFSSGFFEEDYCPAGVICLKPDFEKKETSLKF